MTDSDLQAAAEKLRALAGQATPAPWATTWRGQEYQLDGNTEHDLAPVSQWTYAVATREPQATEQRAECDTADADYIAAMDPSVGAAVADWLGCLAALDPSERGGDECGWCGSNHAQTVARAINGSTP